mmetsp:Transcript_12052/g.14943  ORF Transcript_12052/g.14943 Transcript_12052/m.14943 type:complete len:95 (+) Transcript_12052:66-350(+)
MKRHLLYIEKFDVVLWNIRIIKETLHQNAVILAKFFKLGKIFIESNVFVGCKFPSVSNPTFQLLCSSAPFKSSYFFLKMDPLLPSSNLRCSKES